MLFAHDTEVALLEVAALVNTMPGSVPGDTDPDRLTTPEELDEFVRSWEWTGSRASGEAARGERVGTVRKRAARGSSARQMAG